MTVNTQGSHDGACDCADFRTTRRTLLKGAAATVGFTLFESTLGGTFRQVAMAADGASSNILVVISLRGGADGLSMVVPYGDPAYRAARPKIAVPEGSLLATDGMFGLHPGFAPLLPMWRAGTFGAAHAVGLPQPNRSHFAAMEEMEDADLGSPERRGWLNRLVGMNPTPTPLQGLQLGRATVPTSLYGPAPVITANSLRSLRLVGPENPDRAARKRRSLGHTWSGEDDALGRAARSTLATADGLQALVSSPGAPANGAVYPADDLGSCLADTARLIRHGAGIETVAIDYGSWDLHVNLGTVDRGPMADNISRLAESLKAFFVDLGSLADRVTVVTVSEFGRRVEENGAGGLDHGYGNAMLLLGAGIAGGKVHAQWPGLGRSNLVSGDLAVTRDYRSVLSEVLRHRFPTRDLSKVFPNFRPEPVGVTTA
ncbi:MAG TPA: DUF1501 domain-containing protein [Nocardioidaceae bacterium]|nr:DUF1501 domain-containing protein [Nocardioidaceae bacterium]